MTMKRHNNNINNGIVTPKTDFNNDVGVENENGFTSSSSRRIRRKRRTVSNTIHSTTIVTATVAILSFLSTFLLIHHTNVVDVVEAFNNNNAVVRPAIKKANQNNLFRLYALTRQQNFLKLLKYSNELKINSKYLGKEDPEAFDTLLNFLVTIENNLHYSEKQEYIELAKDFLADQITADDFSYSFQAIYEGIGEELRQMQRKESLELVNFLKSSRPQLGRLLAQIYGSCDSFSLDPDINMVDEQELKDGAQILLVELQKE